MRMRNVHAYPDLSPPAPTTRPRPTQAAVVPNAPGAGASARITLATPELQAHGRVSLAGIHVAAAPRGGVFAGTDEIVARYDVCRAAAPAAEAEEEAEASMTPWSVRAGGTATWQVSACL